MKSSDQQAKDAGVLFLNEMGLDPGNINRDYL